MPPDKILFLDRDGTLMPDTGYPSDPDTVTLIPGAAEGVRRYAEAGFLPIVVSNQSGIGRGIITAAQANAVHERLIDLFAKASGLVLHAYYCPHDPNHDCECRKPKIGLLSRAAQIHKLTYQPAIMIGDKLSDMIAGKNYGAKTIWFNPNELRSTADNTQADATIQSWHDLPDPTTWFPHRATA